METVRAPWPRAASEMRSLVCTSIRALAIGTSLSLLGCNAILGIDAPIEVLSDGGLFQPDAQLDEDAGHLLDGGDTPLADPHARPRWPMPNPLQVGSTYLQDYTVEGDVVLDTVTGLTWQRVASASPMVWSEAVSFCEALSIDGGGFRLPSRIELLSLVDLTQSGSAIDGSAFPSTPPEGFWSVSRSADIARSAWGVGFGFSTSVAFQAEQTELRRVRCVRSSSPEPGESRYVVEGGVVEDTATRLSWQREPSSLAADWTAATQACASLTLAGSGWRLPTLKELHTLVDETRALPAIDSAALPTGPTGFYWTSSNPKGFFDLAWTVGFERGLDVFRNKTTTALSRCVR